MEKLIKGEDIEKVAAGLRKKGIVVTTNGSFDLFHAGHLNALEFAKKQGDYLIVGLNSDSSIRKIKGEKRPIIPEKDRAEILCALSCVDHVVIFDEELPSRLLEKIKPNVHVKGSEYMKHIPEKGIVEKNGGKVIFMKRDETDISTSQIIQKIIKLYGDGM